MIHVHTIINISPCLIPDYGSHYKPFLNAILLLITTAGITLLWGTKILADYTYSFGQRKEKE